jgi:VWFA-related protein
MKRAIIVALVLAAVAQQGTSAGGPVEQAPTYRTAATIVPLQVTVLDGTTLVAGLGAQDFAVFEDGVAQEVRFFDSDEVPMDVVLLLDTSSSMTGRMTAVHEAAEAFMKILRQGDRGAVVAFNESLNIVQPLTEDRLAIERAIRSTKPFGGTSLRAAVYVALKEFGKAAPPGTGLRRLAVVVLTDGQDTASIIPFDDVLKLARNTGVNLYTITLRPPRTAATPPEEESPEADFEMRKLAQDTGAAAFFPKDVYEVRDAYSRIASELVAKYALAYAPQDMAPDGRFRRIDVKVVSNGAYQAKARSGYTADGLTRVVPRETAGFAEAVNEAR